MTPSNFKNITGERFGRLVVIKREGSNSEWETMWLCQCDCGATKIIRGKCLRRGTTQSCGCLQLEGSRNSKHNIVHGGTGSPEFVSWQSMRNRCNNPNDKDYPHYGGRGISICKRWNESFSAFLADMGTRPTPKHSIDRWPDNNGNYEPGNCRWATVKQQANNRRSNRWLVHNGKTMTLTQWSEATGILKTTIRERLRRGWSIACALDKATVFG